MECERTQLQKRGKQYLSITVAYHKISLPTEYARQKIYLFSLYRFHVIKNYNSTMVDFGSLSENISALIIFNVAIKILIASV